MPDQSRIYYTDAYRTHFEAQVVKQLEIDGQPAVVLNATAFYPTSGGQPHDLGTLEGVAVQDVVVDEQGQVLHVLAAPLDVDVVTGAIDWQRRFDFMQHHTGQHILSRAFEVVADAETVGFHLTETNATIDLNRRDLSAELLTEVENQANDIIFRGITVDISFPDEAMLAALPLRKISEKIQGDVRVVSIGEFDVCACGGTHVRQTGEVGMIKIINTEQVRQQTRITFACGQRALQDYRYKNAFLNEIAARYTMSYKDVPATIEKLRDENKQLQKQLKATRAMLMTFQAQQLWKSAATATPQYTIVSSVFDKDEASAGDLQILARELIAHPRTVALLGVYGSQTHLVFARSEDVTLNVVPHLKRALDLLGTHRGGGRPNMAQGGGVEATQAAVEQALAAVRDDL